MARGGGPGEPRWDGKEDANVERLVRESVKVMPDFWTEDACREIEALIEEVGAVGRAGKFREKTVDRTPLRAKYFFGYGYTYGSQISGKGAEQLLPPGMVDPIPGWIEEKLIRPLEKEGLVKPGWINSAVVNDYRPGGMIVSHIDPPKLFARPIFISSFFAEGRLVFGSRFSFPHKGGPPETTPPKCVCDMPRGSIMVLEGFSADGITHGIRPQDMAGRRVSIVFRHVFADAPKLGDRPSNLPMAHLPRSMTPQPRALQCATPPRPPVLSATAIAAALRPAGTVPMAARSMTAPNQINSIAGVRPSMPFVQQAAAPRATSTPPGVPGAMAESTLMQLAKLRAQTFPAGQAAPQLPVVGVTQFRPPTVGGAVAGMTMPAGQAWQALSQAIQVRGLQPLSVPSAFQTGVSQGIPAEASRVDQQRSTASDSENELDEFGRRRVRTKADRLARAASPSSRSAAEPGAEAAADDGTTNAIAAAADSVATSASSLALLAATVPDVLGLAGFEARGSSSAPAASVSTSASTSPPHATSPAATAVATRDSSSAGSASRKRASGMSEKQQAALERLNKRLRRSSGSDAAESRDLQ